MHLRKSLLLLPPSLALASFSDVVPTKQCPILGPVFPGGFDLTKSDAIQRAKERLPSIFDTLLSSGIIPANQTSFTIDIFSTSTNASLYSYAHSASALDSSLTAGVLNDQTIFRTGSVSKLYTAYAIIVQAGIEVLDHPVTQYLPELAGNSRQDSLTKIIWEDVTVGALAAHQGGTGGPPLELTECYPGNCTVAGFLAMMKDKSPVTSPWQTPEYSDAGYAILGRVLERLTGMQYEEAIHNILSVPLGLNSTSTTVPTGDDVNALAITNIPITTWGFDFQGTASSGGVYANNADLRALGLSILNHELLSEAVTRQWMKPRGHTSTLTFSVGAPWEITRMTIPVTAGSNRTRVTDLYAKGGGNPPYGAVLALSPDHGIGFSILVAGDTALTDRWTLRDAIAETFVPAAELAAEANAVENFVGTFIDDSADGTNLTLVTDEGLPGLRLESLFIGGIDWRANLTIPGGVSVPGGGGAPDGLIIRLYPSGLATPLPSSDGVVGMLFNAIPYSKPLPARAAIEGGDGLFDEACLAWFSVGFFHFGGNAIDQFMFYVQDGRLAKVAYGAAGATMKRID